MVRQGWVRLLMSMGCYLAAYGLCRGLLGDYVKLAVFSAGWALGIVPLLLNHWTLTHEPMYPELWGPAEKCLNAIATALTVLPPFLVAVGVYVWLCERKRRREEAISGG